MNVNFPDYQEKRRQLQKWLVAETAWIRWNLTWPATLEKVKPAKSNLTSILEAQLGTILVAPVILSMIIPVVILDISLAFYQAICVPVYGIKKVPRSDFVVIDRGGLEYLNHFERFYCVYCGYANGVIGWARQMAARTEEYWCPIKHAKAIKDPHPLYGNFSEFGDEKEFRNKRPE